MQFFRKILSQIIQFIDKYHFWIFLGLLLVSFLPLIINQENAYITIHDNLDSEIPIRVVLKNSGTLFDYQAHIDQIMNGLPRMALTSGANMVMLLFMLFPPITAYIVNHIIVHSIAFVGMYILLRTYIIGEDNLAASGAALCFSLLPFYSIYGLSIAGLPILLFSILSVKLNSYRKLGYLIIFLFPLYSSLVYVGIFILVTLGVWLLIDIFQKKSVFHFLLSIILLGISYIAVEWNLIVSQFSSPEFISHRADWGYWLAETSLDTRNALLTSLEHFFSGTYHAASLHPYIIFLFFPAALWISLRVQQRIRYINLLLLFAFVFSLTNGFSEWAGLIPIKEKFPILNMLRIRFDWFNPVLWYMIFALVLNFIYHLQGNELKGWKKWSTVKENKTLVIMVCLTMQIVFIVRRCPEITGTITAAVERANNQPSTVITYQKFYSTALFDEINKTINQPQESYRILNIGLFPGIAQYNGFYTLDSYQNNYPLLYKKEFRKIIEAELNKNVHWMEYFDSWGSRCYIFPAELDSYSIIKTQAKPIHNLELSSPAVKEIASGKEVFLFSAVEILNYLENDLVYLGYFENPESPWGIYLYRFN